MFSHKIWSVKSPNAFYAPAAQTDVIKIMVQICNPVFNHGYFAGGDEEYIYMNKVIVTGQNQDKTGESIIFTKINLQNFCEDENGPWPANMSLTYHIGLSCCLSVLL